MKAEFVVPGPPQSKQRPKVTVRGNYAHAYTPKETVIYENYVKLMFHAQCKGIYLEGALKAEIIGYFPIPASISKKKKAQMLKEEIRHTKKIDCDNLAKTILDSLNGVAYKDDAQVCDLTVRKLYGEEPKVIVFLEEVDGISPVQAL